MAEKKKKLFSADDFDKRISVGEQLVFDKQDLNTVKIDLIWDCLNRETDVKDLDVCAFLLGDDNMMNKREDLVYFKSQHRWKTQLPFDDPNFNPLEGRVSGTWIEEGFKNPIKWMEETLPLSGDKAVIGSWDDKADDGTTECGETLHVILNEVDVSQHSSIVLAAVVAKDEVKAGKSFADAKNPIVRIYDAEKDELIAEYKLAEKFPSKDAVCFGRLVYDENEMLWSFEPMAKAYNGGMQFLATEIYG